MRVRRAAHAGPPRTRTSNIIPIRALAGYLFRVAASRLRRQPRATELAYDQVVRGPVWACTDLGAFPRPLARLPGVEAVVLMEDRHPQFFLSFREYTPRADTGLDRHGPLHRWSTQRDLLELVGALHAQGIRVVIGCWNYGGWWPLPPSRWLRGHPELRRVPGSADLNPFVRLTREGVSYAEYIGCQYERLRAAFGFDGLMLGDGFCGFGSFVAPDLHSDRADTIPQWTEFYRTVATHVHASNGVLVAYDYMGFPPRDARRHGADYRALAGAGLDILVYQAYPQAWGRYWLAEQRGRFGLHACARNLATVRAALTGTGTRILYTVELMDSVERWTAEAPSTSRQMVALDPLADGRFLVWANDLFARR
ncbi:MAG TPA: hypothetical protein VKZ50_12805 [bacterium]|nr:hypothetical protein [bacterium]